MHDEGERRKKRGPEVRETTESFIGASRKCRNNSEKFVQEYVQKKLFHTSLYFNSCKIINFFTAMASIQQKEIQLDTVK